MSLLALLGSDALSVGTCRPLLSNVLTTVYHVPGLLGCIKTAAAEGSVSDPSPIAWWLLRVAVQDEHARQDQLVHDMADLLMSSSGAAKCAAKDLKVVLSGAVPSLADQERLASMPLSAIGLGPGGRHDNDHADYRNIDACPTAAEVRGVPAGPQSVPS
eukprot:366472-Chlamydomonas_euryale.AAC.4